MADLVVVDLDEPWVVREGEIARARRIRLRGRALRQGLADHGRGPHSLHAELAGSKGAHGQVPVSLALALGYLLGSIPFGLILITRAAGLGDVRKIGSGNIGATNVLRTGHKRLAAATLLLECSKGTAAVLIAGIYGAEAAIAGGLGAFLGQSSRSGSASRAARASRPISGFWPA